MTKFFNILKKPCFWPIFPIFGQKNFFLENPALSRTLYGFLASCQNLEKTNVQFQENTWTDGRMGRKTDIPYFIGPFRLPLGVQKIKIANLERNLVLRLIPICKFQWWCSYYLC